MRAPQPLLDSTNAVSIGDDHAVASAVDQILERSFGAGSFDGKLLQASFSLVGRLFAGEYPGYLRCDMPYHDLRHSLDTALVMARLIAGYQSEHGVSSDAFSPDFGLLGVLLGLLHDTGYIRKASEVTLCGPQLSPPTDKSMSLSQLGDVHRAEEDLLAAASCYEESLALARERGAHSDVTIDLCDLAMTLIGRGSVELVFPLLREALAIAKSISDETGGHFAFDVAAGLGALVGEWTYAARLNAAVEVYLGRPTFIGRA